ncbi:MAG: BACON domain-containing carbohydrate-binding protein [Vicinamibacterales bacterium]
MRLSSRSTRARRARHRWPNTGAALVLTVAAAACSSAELSVSAPSAAKCQVSVDNSLQTAPATGATGMLAVATTRDCAWDAASAAGWIVITDGRSGQGAGEVHYRVSPNSDPLARQGTLEVNGTQLSIHQEPAPCRFVVSPTTVAAAASGARLSIGIQTPSACSWTAVPEAPWISASDAGTERNGDGSVTLAIAANGGAARTGTVRVADQTVSVDQPAASTLEPPPAAAPEPGPQPAPPPGPTPPPEPLPPEPPPGPPPEPAPEPEICMFAVEPTQVSLASDGAAGSVAVTTTAACSWAATSDASWLVISSGSSGSATGTVQYVAAANSGPSERTATLTIGDRIVTVTQAGPPPACTYAISPSSLSVDRPPTTVPVSLTTAAGCAWIASTEENWLAVTPVDGSGSTSLTVSVDRLTGNGTRTGTVTIAGQTFTITQARD